MGTWANPDAFTVAFRLTTAQYANAFVNCGSVKFNTPQSWIDYYSEHGNGRGDIYEGTLAFCEKYDTEHLQMLVQDYSSPLVLNVKNRPIVFSIARDRLLFKDARSLQLPCFCVYIMKNSLFQCPDHAGKYRTSAVVPASYFRDFADNAIPEDINKRSFEKHPALIAIFDFSIFKKRLYDALFDIGIKESEIILGSVFYENFDKFDFDTCGWFDFNQKYPKELLIKDLQFHNQSEARFIINIKNKEAIRYLNENDLKLGNMSDIAAVSNTYFYDGLEVNATLDVEVETELQ